MARALGAASLLTLVAAQMQFLSLGNWGTGSADQFAVAEVLKQKAAEAKATIIVSPGSNFQGGISSTEDERWSKQFAEAYMGDALSIPFFSVLGEEDWGRNYNAQISGDVQAEPSGDGPRWTMPNWWYHYTLHFTDSSSNNFGFSKSDVSAMFVFIDTNILSTNFKWQNITAKAWDDLKDTLEAGSRIADWVIVVADQSIHSSGSSKGNAYLRSTLLPVLKENLVDLYISGNDRDIEFLSDEALALVNCGTGGGGELFGMRLKNEKSEFYDPRPGFCLHSLTKRGLVTQAIDGRTGEVVATQERQRQDKPVSFMQRFGTALSLPTVGFTLIPDLPTSVPIPESDVFVKVVGSIGLLLIALMASTGATTLGVKLSNP